MPKPETRPVNVRMPVALIEFLDYAVKEGSKQLPPHLRPRTRSDAVKRLLVAGMIDAIYSDPNARWRIHCKTQAEEHSKNHGKYAKDRDEDPMKYDNLGERFGTSESAADAEEKLKKFLISEEGYMKGYGRRDFEIYAVDEQDRLLEDLLRNQLGADYDDCVAFRRHIETSGPGPCLTSSLSTINSHC